MKNEMDIAGRIEQNRAALIRMVSAWLLLAQFLAGTRTRALPRRVSHFIASVLTKVEKATYYLVIATARGQHANFQLHHLFAHNDADKPMHIQSVVTRLQSIVAVLNALNIYGTMLRRMVTRSAHIMKMRVDNGRHKQRVGAAHLARRPLVAIETPAPP